MQRISTPPTRPAAIISPPAPSYCPDCGPATVPHWIERWSVRTDAIFSYFTKPPELVWRAIKPLVARLRLGRLAPAFAHILATLRIGTIITAPDEKDNWRTRVLWEEAMRRGIAMKEFRPFGLARDLFFASYKNDTVVFDGLPRPRTARESSITWMDDKGIIIKKFGNAGIPMPRGKSCTTFAQAERVWKEIAGPVVVKPNLGSRSRHTYVNVNDSATLRHAFKKTRELSPYAVVEEELPGFVFRVTLVNGAVAGIMRREPPHVIGDGKQTVRELIAIENKNPLRQGPIFHTIEIGDPAISLDSIPAKGKVVILHPKVSRAYGASTTEMADGEVHPDNHALFIKIGEVLDDPLVGVDFMIEDMARSWREQKCGVIECNSLPFIDLHHYPLKGTPRNVAGKVWEMIFSEMKLR